MTPRPREPMPRRNRKKLHRDLRRRAEARKAMRHAARKDRIRERKRVDAMCRLAIARSPGARRSPRASAIQLEGLMRLAAVSAEHRQRVQRIFQVVGREIPPLQYTDQLPWFLLLSNPRWVRDPESFRAPSGSLKRKRDMLALHLFSRYRPPAFLLRALDVEPVSVARVPVEDLWAVQLLSSMASGHSLYELTRTAILPAPLTRRMCHRFQTAKADTPPIAALRIAQVTGFGGSLQLARRLMQTRLGGLRGPDPLVGEPFWHPQIGWIARHSTTLENSAVGLLEALLGWMEASQRRALAEGRRWSMAGRSVRRVLSTAEAWRRDQSRPARGAFPPSGLISLEEELLSIREITSEDDLREEGRELRHCATAYRRLIQKGKVALFSMRREGRPTATVEVALGAGRVVQVKQSCNRDPTPTQVAAVERFASLNRLVVQIA